MRGDLITVSGEAELKTCAEMMLDKQISSLIVTGNNGSPGGIFTKSDLVYVYAKHYEGKDLVKNYMTRNVRTIAPNHSIYTVLAIMIKDKVSRVIVVRNQKPVVSLPCLWI